MKPIKLLIISVMAAILTGCAFIMGPANGYVTMMQRDTGKTYTGTFVGDRVSKATVNITLDGVNYTGTFVLAESNESVTIGSSFGNSFGTMQANVYGNSGRYASAYGSGSSFSTGTGVSSTTAGTRIAKGILTAPNGRGLRCESTATGHGGAGICIDGKGSVYDIVLTM